jgi:beta-glucanase (GH16 family)
MKRFCEILSLFLLIGLSSFAQPEQPQHKYLKDGYQLVWQDDFNKPGKPDSLKWSFEEGFVRNNELQWYEEENAWCEDGLLMIEARKEAKSNPLFMEGSQEWRKSRKVIEYTSSSMKTEGKHSWLYGRFEMRAKINIAKGLWPAWWTLGVKNEWPSNGEIDIMEYYKGRILANIAVGTAKRFNAHWFSHTVNVDSLGGEQWASAFHIWRMDWDEKEIALYMDDDLLLKIPMDQLYNRNGAPHPFKQPHYMLLNLAIGGDNGGDPEGTAFPNRYEIDYVRVYQKQ